MRNEAKEHTYAFQLKHCMKGSKDHKICLADLYSDTKKKKLAFQLYIEKGMKLLKENPDVILILFTNRECAFDANAEFYIVTADNRKIYLRIQKSTLENADDPGFNIFQLSCSHTYKFQILRQSDQLVDYQKFFDRFYLFCCQKNSNDIKKALEHILPYFQEWDNFTTFIKEWNLTADEKLPLNRETVILKLIEYSFPINFPNLKKDLRWKQDEKSFFEHMFMTFDITVLDKNSQEINSYAKNLIDEYRVDDACSDDIRKRFFLNTDNTQDRGILLWHSKKMPLIIDMTKGGHQKLFYELLRFLGEEHKKHFILVADEVQQESLGKNSVLQNLSDLNEKHKLGIRNLVIQFNENHSCILKDLVAGDKELEQQFNVTDIIQIYFLKKIEEDVTSFVFFVRHEATPIMTNDILKELPENELCVISCNGHEVMFQKLKEQFNNKKNIDLYKHFSAGVLHDIISSCNFSYYFVIPSSAIPDNERSCAVKDFRLFRRTKIRITDVSGSNSVINAQCINLLCTHVVTNGKKNMMNHLQKHSPKRIWPIVINLEKYGEALLQTENTDFMNQVINSIYTEDVTKRFATVMKNRGEILILWTGLEDLASEEFGYFIRKLDSLKTVIHSQWLCPINDSTRLQMKEHFDSESVTYFEPPCSQC